MSLVHSTGHVVRDCPNFKCFRCGKHGHYARECNEGICNECEKGTGLCVCETPVEMEEEESERELWDLFEVDDEEENEEEENSAALEEVRTDTWSRKDETQLQSASDKETSSKARNVETSKGQRTEERDGEITKKRW